LVEREPILRACLEDNGVGADEKHEPGHDEGPKFVVLYGNANELPDERQKKRQSDILIA
jgi:hypothetical protein